MADMPQDVMENHALFLLGVAYSVPDSMLVRDRLNAAGIKRAQNKPIKGWERVCVSPPTEHPSTMATAAAKAALDMSGIPPEQVRLVISTGGSRDFNPPWSLATEVMRQLKMPSTTTPRPSS